MYDERCIQLARLFLDGEPAKLYTEPAAKHLAQVIQDAIDGELEEMRSYWPDSPTSQQEPTP